MTVDLTIPTSWKELTLEQFGAVVDIMLMHLTEQERLFALLCQLAGIRLYGEPTGSGTEVFTRKSDGQRFTMQDYEMTEFCEKLRWMLATEPDCVPNPSKSDAYLREMSFGDWFEADTQFRMYDDDQDLAHFDIILPKLGMVAKPIEPKLAVMLKLWWHSVMASIAPLYPNVFEKGDPKEVAQREYNPFKQLQEFHLMLNDNRPQDNERIDNARLHDVLSALDYKIECQKREAAQLKRMGKPRRRP